MAGRPFHGLVWVLHPQQPARVVTARNPASSFTTEGEASSFLVAIPRLIRSSAPTLCIFFLYYLLLVVRVCPCFTLVVVVLVLWCWSVRKVSGKDKDVRICYNRVPGATARLGSVALAVAGAVKLYYYKINTFNLKTARPRRTPIISSIGLHTTGTQADTHAEEEHRGP